MGICGFWVGTKLRRLSIVGNPGETIKVSFNKVFQAFACIMPAFKVFVLYSSSRTKAAT